MSNRRGRAERARARSLAKRPGNAARERAAAALNALALRTASIGARAAALLAVAAVLKHRAPSVLAPARPRAAGSGYGVRRSTQYPGRRFW